MTSHFTCQIRDPLRTTAVDIENKEAPETLITNICLLIYQSSDSRLLDLGNGCLRSPDKYQRCADRPHIVAGILNQLQNPYLSTGMELL